MEQIGWVKTGAEDSKDSMSLLWGLGRKRSVARSDSSWHLIKCLHSAPTCGLPRGPGFLPGWRSGRVRPLTRCFMVLTWESHRTRWKLYCFLWPNLADPRVSSAVLYWTLSVKKWSQFTKCWGRAQASPLLGGRSRSREAYGMGHCHSHLWNVPPTTQLKPNTLVYGEFLALEKDITQYSWSQSLKRNFWRPCLYLSSVSSSGIIPPEFINEHKAHQVE